MKELLKKIIKCKIKGIHKKSVVDGRCIRCGLTREQQKKAV